jgi:hypothetical protein
VLVPVGLPVGGAVVVGRAPVVVALVVVGGAVVALARPVELPATAGERGAVGPTGGATALGLRVSSGDALGPGGALRSAEWADAGPVGAGGSPLAVSRGTGPLPPSSRLDPNTSSAAPPPTSNALSKTATAQAGTPRRGSPGMGATSEAPVPIASNGPLLAGASSTTDGPVLGDPIPADGLEPTARAALEAGRLAAERASESRPAPSSDRSVPAGACFGRVEPSTGVSTVLAAGEALGGLAPGRGSTGTSAGTRGAGAGGMAAAGPTATGRAAGAACSSVGAAVRVGKELGAPSDEPGAGRPAGSLARVTSASEGPGAPPTSSGWAGSP